MDNIRAEEMSLDQLYELLAQTTLELLKLVEEKKDEITIKNIGREIEMIHSLIEKKKESLKRH